MERKGYLLEGSREGPDGRRQAETREGRREDGLLQMGLEKQSGKI